MTILDCIHQLFHKKLAQLKYEILTNSLLLDISSTDYLFRFYKKIAFL